MIRARFRRPKILNRATLGTESAFRPHGPRAYEKAPTSHEMAGLIRASYTVITAALDAGAPLRDAQVFARHSDPRITTRYDRGRQNLDRHAAHLVSAYIAGGAVAA